MNTPTSIHPKTTLGHVHYTVANLNTQVNFYQNILGFTLLERQANTASLGTPTTELLRLTESPGAQPSRGATGLYHTAFLLPTRWDLAHLLKRIAEARTPIEGTANHGTHHALYLPDAEGNGIELAWDFPENQWPKTAQEMFSANRALSPDEIFSAIEDQPEEWPGLPDQTKVGHVHLHVADIPESNTFYHQTLGWDIPLDFTNTNHPIANTALFFSAGGYHHHIGTNIWQGQGASPPPENATGLRYFTVILPDEEELKNLTARAQAAKIETEETDNGTLLRDPAQNGISLTT